MRELHRTPSRPAGRTGPQGRLSHSVLQLFRNALAIRAEDELIDLLQIGKAVYTDVAKQMRTELWLSVLKVKRLGSIAARNYRLMLAKVREACQYCLWRRAVGLLPSAFWVRVIDAWAVRQSKLMRKRYHQSLTTWPPTVQPLPEEVSGDIEKDVGRTFPAVPRCAS